MKLIVGLGNPGLKYLGTRHNVGFDAIDYIAYHLNISIDKNKFKSLIGEGIVNGQKVIFMKPQTYMNLSGEAVIECMNWYKITTDDILIMYDDVSFDLATIKIKKTGSAGGHNGIKNIILHTGTQNFPRVKIGVGQKPSQYTLADYVLGKFTPQEVEELKAKMPDLKSAVELFITKDLETAMNKYNIKQVGEKNGK